MNYSTRLVAFSLLGLLLLTSVAQADQQTDDDLKKIGTRRGIVALLGFSNSDASRVIKLAEESELILYVQSETSQQVLKIRQAAESAGLLGKRIFVDSGSLD